MEDCSLKETYIERRGLMGCLAPLLIGAFIGILLGWFLAPQEPANTDMPMGMGLLCSMVGACVGMILGSIGGFLLDKRLTEQQRREEEF